MSSIAQLLKKTLQRPKTFKLGPIGLNFGLENIYMVQLETGENGPRLRANISAPYPSTREALLASPKEFKAFIRGHLRRNGFKGLSVVSRLPGDGTRIMNMSYQYAKGQDEDQTIINTVMQQLGGSVDEYVIDYLPIRSKGKGSKLEIKSALMAVARRADVLAYLELLNRAGLTILALDVGPAALRRLVVSVYSETLKSTVLLVNFGKNKSFLTVVSGRRLLMDRSVDFGENMLISRLANTLDMDEGQVLKILRGYGVGDNEDSGAEQAGTIEESEIRTTITEILKPLFLEFAEEVNKVLMYIASETRGESVDQIFLLGGSVARYRGVDRLLAEILAIPFRVLNPFAKTPVVGNSSNTLTQAPDAAHIMALGLALRGMEAWRK